VQHDAVKEGKGERASGEGSVGTSGECISLFLGRPVWEFVRGDLI